MTNSLESYKLLNLELMGEVQKLRMMVAEYRRQVVSLVGENMGLREAQILQNAGQRQNPPGGVKKIVRRWKFDSDCLGSPPAARASRTPSTNCRRDSYIDILEVTEDAIEIGRQIFPPPPIIPTIANADEDDSSDDDEKWKPKPNQSLFRKVRKFFCRPVKKTHRL